MSFAVATLAYLALQVRQNTRQANGVRFILGRIGSGSCHTGIEPDPISGKVPRSRPPRVGRAAYLLTGCDGPGSRSDSLPNRPSSFFIRNHAASSASTALSMKPASFSWSMNASRSSGPAKFFRVQHRPGAIGLVDGHDPGVL